VRRMPGFPRWHPFAGTVQAGVRSFLAQGLRSVRLSTPQPDEYGVAKTGGNPFFAIQFVVALAEDRLLKFDPVTGAWQWHMDRIRALSYTDNVVDLMAGKRKRFSGNAGAQCARSRSCCGCGTREQLRALLHRSRSAPSDDQRIFDIGPATGR